jgi:hypothetical protein
MVLPGAIFFVWWTFSRSESRHLLIVYVPPSWYKPQPDPPRGMAGGQERSPASSRAAESPKATMLEKIALEKCRTLCHYGRMKPEAFGLQAAVTGGNLPEEWQALIASQASLLATLFTQIQTTAVTLRRQQAPAAQLQTLAAEAERMLIAQAQGHVGLERELVELRALVMDFSTSPAALAARVRTLESAIEVLHGNLAIARQYLATVFPQEP